MIVELQDTADTVFHEAFQEWRDTHPSGIFLTLETKTKANLHGHFGGILDAVADHRSKEARRN